ncbi:MAG: glycosyltransferase [Acidobacteria bacterium]|nr:glycosyltransferase [Acidobacteriota bacterium]
MLSGHSIICFAGEDWWYHHPHSKNHIMKRLARDNKVMFINSISMGLPSVRSKDFFSKVRRKLKSYLKFVRRSPEGIWVVTPIVTPFFSSAWGRTLNKYLLIIQLRILMFLLGFSNPVLWIAIPTAKDVVGKLSEKILIYQVSDKYEANDMDHGARGGLIRSLHQELQKQAAIIYYSGKKLFSEAEHKEKSYLLEQAVDFEHFASVTGKKFSPPSDFQKIKKPILGYFGAIEAWLVDQELIRYVSQKRPDWQWVFIGLKTRPLEVEELPNVYMLGSKNYYDLPAFAAQFDVCVLPWVTNNEFVNYGSAIKVREYLATGKPVVITPLYEYEALDGILRIARSYDHFIELIEQALKDQDMAARLERQETVANSTWDIRTEEVSQLIEEKLLVK